MLAAEVTFYSYKVFLKQIKLTPKAFTWKTYHYVIKTYHARPYKRRKLNYTSKVMYLSLLFLLEKKYECNIFVKIVGEVFLSNVIDK